MLVLDVGCGNYPRGHVNLDLYPEKTLHRTSGSIINTKGINFVKGSAEFLPFRNESFDIVFSDNIMEHLENPILFLRECLRVAKSKVEVIVPHRYARNKLQLFPAIGHRNFFNLQWFQKVLRGCAYFASVELEPKPHMLFPLVFWVRNMKITIYKE